MTVKTDYTLTCQDETVVSQYHKMRSDGFKDTAFDIDGNNDITCAEINDLAIEHPERYHEYLRLISGREVPWLLDDFNDETDFDRKIREKIDTATGWFEQRLREQGFEPRSSEYDQRLSIALYHFAHLPTAKQIKAISGGDIQHFEIFREEFYNLGFISIYEKLIRSGGLGLMTFSGDAVLEATALEALSKKGKGLCTERTKILYAVFKRAGLDARFGLMPVRNVKKANYKVSELFSASVAPPFAEEDYLTGHALVGVKIGDEVRYFEPNTPIGIVDFYQEFTQPITPREFYQTDIYNLIYGYLSVDIKGVTEGERIDAAERLIAGAFALGDSSEIGNIYYLKYELAVMQNKKGEYKGLLKEAIKRTPHCVRASIAYCALLLGGDHVAAEQCYKELPKDSVQQAVGLGKIAYARGDYESARQYLFKALENGYDKKAESYHAIAITYVDEGNYKEAEKNFRLAIKEERYDIKLYIGLYEMLRGQGKDDVALGVLQSLMGVLPLLIKANYEATRLLMDMGRLEEAKHYFRKYVMTSAESEGATSEIYNSWVIFAEKLGGWEFISRACYRKLYYEYIVFGLHSSWKSGDRALISRALERYDGALGFKDFDPAGVNLDVLVPVAVVIDSLPEEMKRQSGYRERFVKFFNFLGAAYEANDKPKEAQEAYKRALDLDLKTE